MIPLRRPLERLRAQAAAAPRMVRWGLLLVLSMIFSGGLVAARLPAALLLGPLLSAMTFGIAGVPLKLARWPQLGTQAVIGAMVSMSVTPAIAENFRLHAALFSFVILSTLVASTFLGWLICRSGWLPGTTAVFGTSPGAASAMVLIGEAEGADARLVAFMQYSRVLLVALSAALVARFWARTGMTSHAPAPWFGAVNWLHLASVLLLALAAQQVARLLRVPAWGILGPLLLLSTLHAMGWLAIDLPRWLLAVAYGVLGWQIGLGFRRDDWARARRLMPVILGSGLALIALCALVAWCLATFAHVNGLTAYLATSPGGLDTVSVIAAGSPSVDQSFVLTLQSLRLLLVIGLAPAMTRFVAQHARPLSRDAPKR